MKKIKIEKIYPSWTFFHTVKNKLSLSLKVQFPLLISQIMSMFETFISYDEKKYGLEKNVALC